ncbi:basic leucine zipper 4 [Cicer arietinum]|uniref:Basic leucine zipper 4 n=1 Tax=Cicer arietinum TaxID=3827 RepID=A0A1S2Y5R4_CICAR|nr:basic leucine zipper 4 [Cicer arietinum]
MSFHEEKIPVRFGCLPVHETMFTQGELEELFSLINQPVDPTSPGSGSQGSNQAVYSIPERKLRRMQSNRESARRSRWRKKRHVENLTSDLNRLRLENRELKNRLGLTMNYNLLLSTENQCLKSESMSLIVTLLDLYRTLETMISQ